MGSSKRILIYSHDTYGLGHLRRCRAIAHGLAARDPSLSVMLLSGSSVIGGFDFLPGVEFIRLPSVVKNGKDLYDSADPGFSLSETLALRARILRDTADIYQPDLFLVDKEPLGVRGEVADCLRQVRRRGTRLVLGLREVLEAPDALRQEWERKGAFQAVEELYDEIWVYGPEWFYNPLAGQPVSEQTRSRMVFTGFLGEPAQNPGHPAHPEMQRDGATFWAWNEKANRNGSGGYILVTAGGGGDGEGLFQWVTDAVLHENALPDYSFVFVLGPFLSNAARTRLHEAQHNHPRIWTLDFETRMEAWMANAHSVVAMGGYNSFCELMANDCRCLLSPRHYPRREQLIRAQRAHEIGLCAFLPAPSERNPAIMKDALNDLVCRPRPSEVPHPPLFGAVDVIEARVLSLLAPRTATAISRLAR